MLTDEDRIFALAALRRGLLAPDELATVLDGYSEGGDDLASHCVRQGLVQPSSVEAFYRQLAHRLECWGAPRPDALRELVAKSAEGLQERLKQGPLRELLAPAPMAARQASSLEPADAGSVPVTRKPSPGPNPDPGSARHGATLEIGPTRYQLGELLGQGGLGTVRRATDVFLGREVAIKQPRPHLPCAEQHRQRFRKEARLTARLDHPNIVPVYGYSPAGDGDVEPACVMRYVVGRTLAETARSDQPLRERLEVFLKICDAIAFAHSKGILHRDLKPENVMVGPFGEVQVMDWGLASELAPEEMSQASQGEDLSRERTEACPTEFEATRNGDILGSPLHLAPEQAAGRIDHVDRRTDVYGLGAILYFLVTGQAVHEPEADCGLAQHLHWVATRESPNPRDKNPRICPALAAIVTRALAREQDDRYPDAQSFGADLRGWLANEPVTAYHEPLSYRVQRWARRHRRLSVGALGCVLTLSFALAAVHGYGLASRRSLLEARHEENADSLQDVARGLTIQMEFVAAELRRLAGSGDVQAALLGPPAGSADSKGGPSSTASLEAAASLLRPHGIRLEFFRYEPQTERWLRVDTSTRSEETPPAAELASSPDPASSAHAAWLSELRHRSVGEIYAPPLLGEPRVAAGEVRCALGVRHQHRLVGAIVARYQLDPELTFLVANPIPCHWSNTAYIANAQGEILYTSNAPTGEAGRQQSARVSRLLREAALGLRPSERGPSADTLPAVTKPVTAWLAGAPVTIAEIEATVWRPSRRFYVVVLESEASLLRQEHRWTLLLSVAAVVTCLTAILGISLFDKSLRAAGRT